MSNTPREPKDYEGTGRTKQAYKDECDINKIMARVAKGNTITHLAKHGAVYGDFTDFSTLQDAYAKMQRGVSIFADLPGEVKREFGNDPAAFFSFVNDPTNKDRLGDVLPGLAKPGNQMPNPIKTLENQAAEEQQAAPEPAPPPSDGDATA